MLASTPFCFCERKSGMAIPARMPMITTTTRSSTRVKPLSFSFMDFCRRFSMGFS